MTIARTYAEFCAGLSFGDLPEEVVEYAKRLTLDTVGIAVGSRSRADSSDSILAAIRALDGGGEATVLATGERMSAPHAAFLNGALAHSLDYDDTHRASSLHPGAPVISAALAAAERTDASGEELLAGIVAGYEVVCRLGMGVNASSHYDRGFHGTGTCGTFGAAAAAGSVMGLSADELEAAFGVNGSQASGSLQFLENGAWNKRIHPGIAAHSGLVAVELAREGFRASSNPVDGEWGFFTGYTDDPEPSLAVRDLGERYELLETGIKPYPCCRYMHASLDLLLDIVEEESPDPASITGVTINLPETGIGIVRSDDGDYPDSFVDAQFSMRFGSALALTRGEAGVDAFLETVEEPYTDAFERLFDATAVEPHPEIEADFPEQWAARVAVETTDGTVERRADHARGEPENPLSDEALTAKFEELVESTAVREPLRERVLSLESRDAADLVEPLADADPKPSTV